MKNYFLSKIGIFKNEVFEKQTFCDIFGNSTFAFNYISISSLRVDSS